MIVRPRAPTSSRGQADRVARMAVGLMTVALVAMLGRVVQLQFHPGERLQEQVQPRITRAAVLAPRGDVTDRLGRYLATSEFGFRAFVDPTEFPDPPDEAIARLAEAVGAPADELGARILSRVQTNKARAPAPRADRPERTPGLGDMLSRLSSAVAGDEDEDEAPGSSPPDEDDAPPPRPIRYVRVSDLLDDSQLDAVKKARIPGVHLEQRSVRANPADGLAASIVGRVNIDHAGAMGVERAHQQELTGADGQILYVRDASGRPLWMSPGAFIPATRGGDVRLSIDLELQRIASEELRRQVYEVDAAGGRAIVMDSRSGEVLAMVDIVRPVPDAVPFPWADAKPAAGAPRSAMLYEPTEAGGPRPRYITLTPDVGRLVHPALARNRCVEDVYEPGSTFKPFVWATVTELGLLKPLDPVDTEGGTWRTAYGRTIRDVVRRPTMTWAEVLYNSSNIGMAKSADRLTHDQLHGAIRRFGFGSRTHVGLQGETAGIVTPRKAWSKYSQTSVSFGHEIAVTPVQMVRAFSVFARTGDLAGTLPLIRLTAADESSPPILHRVLRPEVAAATREILHEVALSMEARMAANRAHPESGWRYAIFGKSGTAEIPLGKAPQGKRRPPGNKGYYDRQYNSNFIAAGPLEDPRLVVLVIIDDPGPAHVRNGTYYGTHMAGPVVRRIMERSLSYLGVPPSRPRPRATEVR